MSNKAQCGVYKITCVPTGKMYIGSSNNIAGRFSKHRSNLRNNVHVNKHLQAAWDKYGGDNFLFEIIELTTPETRQERESYWLDYYQAFNREYGYNAQISAAPIQMSLESRAKISAAFKGKPLTPDHRAKIKAALNTPAAQAKRQRKTGRKMSEKSRNALALANANRVVSPETRAKLRAANLGKKLSPEQIVALQAGRKAKLTPEQDRRRVQAAIMACAKRYICIAPDGTIHDVYNLNAFCREHNLISGNMALVASGKRPTHRGWRCQRVENENNPPRHHYEGD